MKFPSFARGGVHPSGNKFSRKAGITDLPAPDEVSIPLSQHIGAPARATVKKGDVVKIGTLIADTDCACSAKVHSSVCGTVKSAENGIITITVDHNSHDTEQLNTENKSLLEIIKDAGIVGMGGASFPTHVKLSPPDPAHIDILVINGAECEPYLTADHRLMMEKGTAVIDGVKLLQGIFPSKPKAFIGIEANKMDAVHHLRRLIDINENIEVQSLKTMYPQGGEKQLIKALIGKEVPSAGLPFCIGIIVQNVGTAFAVHEAYRFKKPLTDRVVTVSGDLVREPVNLKVPIGAPVSYLLKYCGVETEKIAKVILGGPMMGNAISNLDTPVTKACSGVLAMSENACREVEERDCIGCGKCVDVCPIGLMPNMLAKLSKNNMVEEAKSRFWCLDCIECGCCSYSCPAGIKIVQRIKVLKAEIKKQPRQRSCPA
ncbi:MAG: electron transport complex subunit RsxC [Oligoflexia bacterium]|nr:electron transport complex subunit RsxC [Oligoflexia bacterium]